MRAQDWKVPAAGMRSPPVSASAQWQATLRVLWGGNFLSIASLMVVAPLLPIYMARLGAQDPQALIYWSGLALAAPAVTYTFIAPLWGRLGDRIGRKWMVVRALFGLALTLGLMGLAQTPFQFFLCRLAQGAFGGVVDSSSAFAGSAAPEEQKGAVFGKLQSAVPAGSLVGPLLGGVLIDLWGFRELLISLSLLMVLWGLMAASMLVERAPRHTSEARRTGEGILRTFRELFKDPRLRLFLLAGVCANIASYGLMTIFAPHVQRLLPSSEHVATWVGFFEAATWGGALLGAAWWGRRNDRLPVAGNFMLAAFCCGLFVMLQGVPKALEWLLLLRFLQGFAFSALIQSVFLTISRASHDGNRGVRVASASSVLVIGQITGGAVSAVLSGVMAPSLVFVTLGGFLLLASLLAALTRLRPLAPMPLPSQSPQP